MTYEITVLRRKTPEDLPYEQTFRYEARTGADTVASALININRGSLTDVNGNKAEPIAWECSCLQKKCGACAMVINGIPRLACDSVLSAVAADDRIRLEPLRKFPAVRDLICDRSVMRENLKTITAWIDEEVSLKDDKDNILFEAGKCLQCGCCLEVCPNFYAEGRFFGMNAMVPVAGILEKLPADKSRGLRKKYSKHIYAGCAKSLACHDICPAGLDIEKLLVNSNAIALWKHLFK